MEQSPANTSTSDLREQLADRFRNMKTTWEEGWCLAAADECIRQMEWARYRAWAHGNSPHVAPLPLTAAPDDWNPKETPNEGV